jgi:hypothetical protein
VMARDDVVDRQQLAAPNAAVLTGEVIPEEDLFPSKARLQVRPLDHLNEPDDRGAADGLGWRAEIAGPVLEDFGFAAVDQDDGALLVADVEWLVVLIQYQYGTQAQHSTPRRLWYRDDLTLRRQVIAACRPWQPVSSLPGLIAHDNSTIRPKRM